MTHVQLDEYIKKGKRLRCKKVYILVQFVSLDKDGLQGIMLSDGQDSSHESDVVYKAFGGHQALTKLTC
jgi:hypothetical protein